MAEAPEEYPIEPTLDRLIQNFKAFKNLEFPRQMPGPALFWKPCLQPLTRHEARMVQLAAAYMGQEAIDESALAAPDPLIDALQAMRPRDAADAEFLTKLTAYKDAVEQLRYDLEDCVRELGNPCRRFRVEGAGKSLG